MNEQINPPDALVYVIGSAFSGEFLYLIHASTGQKWVDESDRIAP